MITPQDIREKSFEKAVFGGYDMATVDEFMEEIANDLALLQKENAVLKSKMKVLVDKVEEYRGSEDALQSAVISAQKLGNSIEREARDKAKSTLDDAQSKADVILRDAQAEADRITGGVSAAARAEETRLEEAKRASAEFLDRMDQLCHRQLELLERVREMDFTRRSQSGRPQAARPAAPAPAQSAPAPAPSAPADPNLSEIHETVKSIEETVAKAMDEPVVNVRPGIAPAVVEDERPTRAFNIVSDAEDGLDKTTQFSLDDFSK